MKYARWFHRNVVSMPSAVVVAEVQHPGVVEQHVDGCGARARTASATARTSRERSVAEHDVDVAVPGRLRNA
jgi:hypothetical protein